VASGGYEATYGDLHAAAAAYVEAASKFQAHLESFTSAAQLSPGDFGRLPSSGQMNTTYQTYYESVAKHMATLQQGLVTGGLKIATTEALYKAADEASTVQDV
jgi:uncharacterized protein YukE